MGVLDYCEISDLFLRDSVSPDEIRSQPLFLSWGGRGRQVSEGVWGEEEEWKETTKYLPRSVWCVGRAWTSESKCLFPSSHFPLPQELWAGPGARLPGLVPIVTDSMTGLQTLGQLLKTLWASVFYLHNGYNNRTFLAELLRIKWAKLQS